jgi:carboxylesterase type B
MTSYLCNFARNGNPNGEDLVKWEPISRKQKNPLILNDKKIEMNKVDPFELFKKMFKRPVGF